MSVNSSVDNDIRKSDLSAKKKNSIKKKVASFSNESDDAALVPLLQTPKAETNVPSAKNILSKLKTESISEKDLKNKDVEKAVTSTSSKQNAPVNTMEWKKSDATVVCNTTVIQNHMNTNVFGNMISASESSTPKTSILIEISEKKSTYGATPLIFTTAKIHTDNKTKTMEPLQVNPLPISSTIEGNLVKSELSFNNSNTSVLPPKLEKPITTTCTTMMTNKDTNQTSKAPEPTKSASNQVSIKSSLNKTPDIFKSTTANLTKTISKVSSSSMVQQNLSSNAKAKTPDDHKAVPKSDTVKIKDTANTQSIKTTIESTNSKLDTSTGSAKKLQRQKRASIEDINNTGNIQLQNEGGNTTTKEVDSKLKKPIITSSVEVKSNGVTQSEAKKSALPTVQTKSVKTIPLNTDLEAISTATPKQTTTTKTITTGIKEREATKPQLGTPSNPTNKLAIKKPIASPNNSKVTKESQNKPTPTATVAKTDSKLKTTSIPSQVKSPSGETSVKSKKPGTSTGIDPPLAQIKPLPVSTPVTSTSFSTPLYIVATSKTKIGVTPTSNTTTNSKSVCTSSSNRVTPSVSVSTASKSANSKTVDAKIKPSPSKT
ncbi:unnamed protein product [Leptosia nina]|uniref:Uncharacterized protein n=1 Tax=Leptosia nina TaxID=320188 RepID=A0AAV1JTR9_9NEOP